MKNVAKELLLDRHIAVIGAGLVGAGWAIVFARSGLNVRIYDSNKATLDTVLTSIEIQLEQMVSYGLIESSHAVMQCLSICATLEEAVKDAIYIQESVLERIDVKQQLMLDLAGLIAADAVVGSSTSGIGASKFACETHIAPQVLVVHPVNPPHLVPVVELVPSHLTSAQALDFSASMMEAVGQSVVRVNKEIEGFVLNRLQGVLLREAWALVADGVASCEDIDKTIKDGLGWRWSFMGPFETIDLNAPGGVADYAHRFGPLYRSIAASRSEQAPWSEELIVAVEIERRKFLSKSELPIRRDWRDKMLMALASFRSK